MQRYAIEHDDLVECNEGDLVKWKDVKNLIGKPTQLEFTKGVILSERSNMKTLTISFKVTKPEHVNKSDFVEWLRFELGRLDSMDENSPMAYANLRDLVKDVVIT